MEVFSYRLANFKFFCHTCDRSFTQMADPRTLEAVRCSTCHSEFVELIDKKESRPVGLPPREEPLRAPAETTTVPPQSTGQPRAQRTSRSVPISFIFTEYDPENSIFYECTMTHHMTPSLHPTSQTSAPEPSRVHGEEGKEEDRPFMFIRESFFDRPMFSPFTMGIGDFDRNFASNFQRRGSPINLMELARLFSMNDFGNAGTPPASKEAVSKLPVFTIEEKHCKKQSEKGEIEPPSCAVCCSNIDIGKSAQLLPCGHMYHPDCLKPWLEMHNTCPVCRHELPTDDQVYEHAKRQRAQQRVPQ